MKKIPLGVIIMLIVVAAAAVSLFVVFKLGENYYSNIFMPGTVINGVDCGGKSAAEVKSELQDSILDYTLTVKARNCDPETIPAIDFGLTYVDDGCVDRIMEEQHEKLWFMSIGGVKSYTAGTDYSFDESNVDTVMNNLACMQSINITAPEDAYYIDNGTEYVIIPETQGCQPIYSRMRE
ncbi:MAG: hypothetical protein IKD85_04625, partial [Firmicutes bacterium]|nr:hypothetical protein [Bacillota bacterium]